MKVIITHRTTGERHVCYIDVIDIPNNELRVQLNPYSSEVTIFDGSKWGFQVVDIHDRPHKKPNRKKENK